MDQFTRFKLLRAIWARAKMLLLWINGPRERDERLRAHRWTQINVAERQIRDGMIRGTGDPDSYLRPRTPRRAGRTTSPGARSGKRSANGTRRSSGRTSLGGGGEPWPSLWTCRTR